MALSVVQGLHKLVQEPKNRVFIVKDHGCLPGLVMFLDNPENNIVELALDTLNMLSMSEPNKPTMAKEKGLIEKVRSKMFSSNDKVKNLAISTYANLQAHATAAAPMQDATNLKTTAYSRTKVGAFAIKPAGLGGGFFSKPAAESSLGSVVTTTLYVKGLSSEEQRTRLESALLKVKGVISFLIDIYEQKATIRTNTPTDTLISAIKNMAGMEATAERCGKENTPDYLPEPDENNIPYQKGSIVTKDAAEKAKAQRGGGGWLGYVSSWWG